MANTGLAPIQEGTLVGQTRRHIGDVNYIPLVPPMTGFGDYGYFSDADIEAFLVTAANSPLRAAGYAYRQLAASAALEGVSIAEHDLRVDTSRRGATLDAIADSFFHDADALDRRTIADDPYFGITGFGSNAADNTSAIWWEGL